MLQTFLSFLPYWWTVVLAVVIIWIICKSFVNVKSTQIAIVERKYFGKEMADGRTVALKGVLLKLLLVLLSQTAKSLLMMLNVIFFRMVKLS